MRILNRKSILLVTYNDYPVYEGLGVRIRNLTKSLVVAGYRVIVFAPNIDNRRPRVEYLDGIQIFRVNLFLPGFLRRQRMVARGLSMVFQCLLTPFVYYSQIRKNKVGYILAEHIYSVPVALIVKMLNGGIVIVDDIINVSEILKESGHSKISWLFTRFEKWLFKYCNHFIYTSEVSKRYYELRGASPDIFAPNGVNCDEFRPDPAKNSRTVVFFNGSTFSNQNLEAIDDFIDIAVAVNNQTDNMIFRLSCWPKYNLSAGIMEKMAKSGPRVEFFEGVDSIEREINNADITILPYGKNHSLNGGARLKALEYMACGKLVISTKEGVEGISGIIPGEHFILAEDTMDFANLILNYSKKPTEIVRIGENARKFVLKNHDWKATTRGLVDALDTAGTQSLDW